jgi:hypothetical protein
MTRPALIVAAGITGMLLLSAVLFGPQQRSDGYEVIASEKNPLISQYAITVAIDVAPAQRVLATWILPQPRTVGTRAWMAGTPALAWRGLPAARPTWRQSRLLLDADADADRRRNDFTVCFRVTTPTPTICYDQAQAVVTARPQ